MRQIVQAKHPVNTEKKRHHSSICDQRQQNSGEERKLMTDGVSGDGVFPVVVVTVNGVKCRALIDSG